MSGVRTSQSDASSDMDLARAPRRTARKKGSGYENGFGIYVWVDVKGQVKWQTRCVVLIVKPMRQIGVRWR